MELATLKLELIQRIIATNDADLLLKINIILENPETSLELSEPSIAYKVDEKVYALNEWQREKIAISLEQVKNGQVLTEEEAEKDIQKWFKEQEKLYGH